MGKWQEAEARSLVLPTLGTVQCTWEGTHNSWRFPEEQRAWTSYPRPKLLRFSLKNRPLKHRTLKANEICVHETH